jgi:hypothetical protein
MVKFEVVRHPGILIVTPDWRPNVGCGGSRGTWKLVSAPFYASRTN